MSEQPQDDPGGERKANRIMWIATAAIMLFLLAMVGANMLYHRDSNSGTGPTDISTQSQRPAR
jgi:hypothetical protein